MIVFREIVQYLHQCICSNITCSDRRDKNKFYAKLQCQYHSLLISLLKHVVIIMGRDRNASAGHDAAKINSATGSYGIGIRYTNEEGLLPLLKSMNFLLIITLVTFKNSVKNLNSSRTTPFILVMHIIYFIASFALKPILITFDLFIE